MFKWYFSKAPADVNQPLLEHIHRVYLDGFAKSEGWSLGGIKQVLTTSSIVGLLKNQKAEIVGYAFYTVPIHTLAGTRVLWENAICIKKELQSRGLTKGIMKRAISVFPDDEFGWIRGRTQNTLVIKRYASVGDTFPFVSSYGTDDGKQVMDYLIGNIEQASDSYARGLLDLTNGICRNVYPGGRLGDYSTRIEGAEAFEQQLLDWGFNRESGDALLVVSRLSRTMQAASS
jgi:hypothetical protein